MKHVIGRIYVEALYFIPRYELQIISSIAHLIIISILHIVQFANMYLSIFAKE